MRKIRDKLISLRVDEDIYDAVKKRAEAAGQTISDFMLGIIEDMLEGNKDSTLLIRNTYDEVLKLGDMLSIMQGFNIEALATLYSRVSLALTPLLKKESKENRGKAIEALQGYVREINERLNNGENVWAGDSYSTTNNSHARNHVNP